MTAHRLGIIGLGDAGYSMHLPAAAGIPSVIVAAACDTDPARCDRASSRFGVRTFATAEEMLASAQLDTVIVATPPESHVALSRLALDSGHNVICEKPFTLTVSDADALIDAAARAQRRIALNHEFREMPIFRAVRDAVQLEGTNTIVFAQVWQQVYLPAEGESGWRAAMGNRVLYEAGVHLIDYMMSIFGSSPESVSAAMSDGGSGSSSDAVAAVTMRFSDGRIGSITINRLAKGENHYFDARVDTVSASYRASFGGRARFTAGLHRARAPHLRFDYGVSGMAWKETGSRREAIGRNPPDPRMRATRDVLAATLAAFDSGGDAPCSAEWARDVVRVIDATYRAAASGRTERVAGG